ncbi:hypothetical protein EUGRSUZ_K01379 [Eucalyptus grandis]|uniref:HMA domain-containing protein n=2 Tax=Eucalyptus grandis TaxID=71139 RepID=A0A059A1S2_EUCGR|nr:hypothetical protein EUGRSUZ_K01379 [Eucalyptus grandis]
MKKAVLQVCVNEDAPTFCCFKLRPSSKSKVVKAASDFRGVKSVTIGDGKDQIEVTGDFDPVNLTVLLRKKVGSAEIITVSKDDARREQRTSDRERRPQHHRRSGPRPRS